MATPEHNKDTHLTASEENGTGPTEYTGSTIKTAPVDTTTDTNGHDPDAAADDIPYEERAQFAGVEPHDEDELVTTDELIDGPSTASDRGVENSPLSRLGLVAGGLGAIAIIIWLFSGFFTGGNQQAQQAEENPVLPTETTSPFGEDDRMRAELALIEQERRDSPERIAATPQRPNQPEATEPETTPESPRTTPTRVSARPTPAPQRATPPEPAASPTVPSLPPPSMAAEPDPLELWSRLAKAGAAGAEVALIPEPEIESNANPGSASLVSNTVTTQSSQAPDESEPFPFPSTTVGDDPIPLPEEEATKSPQISQGRQPTQTLLASTPGARGILNQQPAVTQEATPDTPNPERIRQVAIGSSTDGEVVVPVVYAGGAVSSRGRFAIEISEPLMDIEGNVALEKGTVLITQLTEILDSNILRQQVVAIVYKDADGQVRQEVIEPGVILIRGENNQPLVAQVRNHDDDSSFGQDLLVGTLSALGNIGSVINAPDSVTTATSGTSSDTSSSSTSTTITSGQDEDVVAAALEGFFTPVSDRISERFDENNDASAAPYLFVPEGQTVSIFVNGLLEVVR